MSSIERLKTKHGRKTIIKMPVRYAYYERTDREILAPELQDELRSYDAQRALTLDDVFRVDELNERTKSTYLIDFSKGESVDAPELLKKLKKQSFCPVYFNSKENPTKAKAINRMRVVEGVQYISILEYSGTKNAVFTFISSEICWVESTKKVFSRNPKTYQLVVRSGGKYTLTENSKAILTNIDMIRFFEMILKMVSRKYLARHTGYTALLRLFIKYFFGGSGVPEEMSGGLKGLDGVKARDLVQMYRVYQNPKLADLPWSVYDLSQIYDFEHCITPYHTTKRVKSGERHISNVKVSLNRYLRRGDTVKAIAACFYGFEYPKSIKKVLFQTKPLEFPYIVYKTIFDLIEKFDVNLVHSFLANKDGTPDFDSIHNRHSLILTEYGFSLKQIKRSDVIESSDILSMSKHLTEKGYVLDIKPKLRDFHDYLMQLCIDDRAADEEGGGSNTDSSMRAIRRRVQERLYRDIDTSESIFNFSEKDLVFRAPRTANEMRVVGKALNICVGNDGYLSSFWFGYVDIVLITTKDSRGKEKFIACLEIRQKYLLQAKLNSNQLLSANPTVLKSLKVWAKAKGVKFATEDVGAKYKCVEYNKVNTDRQEIFDNALSPRKNSDEGNVV